MHKLLKPFSWASTNKRRVTWLVALLALTLVACGQVLVTEMPAPVLVTLPASTRPPVTPTQPGATAPSTETATATPTEPPPPTPIPQQSGIGATSLLWEWSVASRPSALAAAWQRLAVIVADGRFVWLDANDGRLLGGNFLWPGLLEGDSWGEIYSDGNIAVAAVREMSINPSSGLVDSRARLVVLDAEANEMWSLPILSSQHFYSAALASGPGLVIVGKWPHGFQDNTLVAYELFSGTSLWEISEGEVGYQQIVHDGTRMYVLLNNTEGGAVACYDLRTGDELWRWADPEVIQPDLIRLGNEALYVLTVSRTLALDLLTGAPRWSLNFNAAPEAGLATLGDLLFLVPAPTVDLGFRPGLVGLEAINGRLLWHSLNGLVADPVAADDEVVWTVVKNYDSGEVFLSGLEPLSGLERVRIPISNKTEVIYQLIATGSRVYVLGDSLRAYGY